MKLGEKIGVEVVGTAVHDSLKMPRQAMSIARLCKPITKKISRGPSSLHAGARSAQPLVHAMFRAQARGGILLEAEQIAHTLRHQERS